jgi:hypothetical protein
VVQLYSPSSLLIKIGWTILLSYFCIIGVCGALVPLLVGVFAIDAWITFTVVDLKTRSSVGLLEYFLIEDISKWALYSSFHLEENMGLHK